MRFLLLFVLVLSVFADVVPYDCSTGGPNNVPYSTVPYTYPPTGTLQYARNQYCVWNIMSQDDHYVEIHLQGVLTNDNGTDQVDITTFYGKSQSYSVSSFYSNPIFQSLSSVSINLHATNATGNATFGFTVNWVPKVQPNATNTFGYVVDDNDYIIGAYDYLNENKMLIIKSSNNTQVALSLAYTEDNIDIEIYDGEGVDNATYIGTYQPYAVVNSTNHVLTLYYSMTGAGFQGRFIANDVRNLAGLTCYQFMYVDKDKYMCEGRSAMTFYADDLTLSIFSPDGNLHHGGVGHYGLSLFAGGPTKDAFNFLNYDQSNFPNSYPQQLVDGPITIYSNGGADDTLMAPNVHAGDCFIIACLPKLFDGRNGYVYSNNYGRNMPQTTFQGFYGGDQEIVDLFEFTMQFDFLDISSNASCIIRIDDAEIFMHNDTRLSLNEPFTLYGTYFEVTYNTIDNDHSSMGMKLHYNARLINQTVPTTTTIPTTIITTTTAIVPYICSSKGPINVQYSSQTYVYPESGTLQYARNQECQWNIFTPSGYYVEITFTGLLNNDNGTDQVDVTTDYGKSQIYAESSFFSNPVFQSLSGATINLHARAATGNATFGFTVNWIKKVAYSGSYEINTLVDGDYLIGSYDSLADNMAIVIRSSNNTQIALSLAYTEYNIDIEIYDGDKVDPDSSLGTYQPYSVVNSTKHALTLYYSISGSYFVGRFIANDAKNLIGLTCYQFMYVDKDKYMCEGRSAVTFYGDGQTLSIFSPDGNQHHGAVGHYGLQFYAGGPTPNAYWFLGYDQSNFPNSYPQQLVDGPITIYSNGGPNDTLMAPNVHPGDCFIIPCLPVLFDGRNGYVFSNNYGRNMVQSTFQGFYGGDDEIVALYEFTMRFEFLDVSDTANCSIRTDDVEIIIHNDTRLSLNEPFILHGTYFEVNYVTVGDFSTSLGMKLHYSARLLNSTITVEPTTTASTSTKLPTTTHTLPPITMPITMPVLPTTAGTGSVFQSALLAAVLCVVCSLMMCN